MCLRSNVAAFRSRKWLENNDLKVHMQDNIWCNIHVLFKLESEETNLSAPWHRLFLCSSLCFTFSYMTVINTCSNICTHSCEHLYHAVCFGLFWGCSHFQSVLLTVALSLVDMSSNTSRCTQNRIAPQYGAGFLYPKVLWLNPQYMQMLMFYIPYKNKMLTKASIMGQQVADGSTINSSVLLKTLTPWIKNQMPYINLYCNITVTDN